MLIRKHGHSELMDRFCHALEPYFLRKLKPFIEESHHTAPLENQGEVFQSCCDLISKKNDKAVKQAIKTLNRQLFKDICNRANL